jgi:hypothetical protein
MFAQNGKGRPQPPILMRKNGIRECGSRSR